MKIIYDVVNEAYFIGIEEPESVTVVNSKDIVKVREEFIRRMTEMFNDAVCQKLSGKVIMERAAEMLKEEMDRDAGNLPPRLHELEDYSVTVMTCDENWGENIEWEKEN